MPRTARTRRPPRRLVLGPQAFGGRLVWRQDRTSCGLELPDPGRAVRAWAEQAAQAPSAAALHLLVDGATGADGALHELRDLLRAAATWCREHEEPDLARRYAHTSDLFDVADRLLYQLGVDLLTAAHEARTAP